MRHHTFAGEWYFSLESFLGYGAPVPAILCIGQALAYLALVYVVAPLLRPTTPAGKQFVNRCRYWHNVFLCLFSLLSFGGALWHLVDQGDLFNFTNWTCNENYPDWLELLHTAFVLSKIYEWLDTCFLVWAAPDMSKLNFLHVYHHATTLVLFAVVGNFPCRKMGLVLNGFVHTLMYAHYAHPFPKMVVPWITRFQIMQLITVIVMWVATPYWCSPRYQRFAFEDQQVLFALPFLMVPVYLLFFLRYYVQRFLKGAKRQRRKLE